MGNREKRKSEIIKNSIHLMYLKGYNSTSVNDIAVAAGIPKGSFYNYFKDKEHYAIDAVDYYKNILVKDNIENLSDHSLKPLDRIRKFILSGIEILVENDYKYGCFAGNLAQEMGDISDAISKVVSEFYDNIVELIYVNLVLAKENNDLNSSIDLKVLSSTIISGMQGAMLRAKVMRNRSVMDEFIIVLDDILLK